MRRSVAVAVITLAAAGAGCDPSTYHDFRAQLAQRTCDRAVACGVVGESERARCPQPAAVLSLAMRDDFDVQAGLDAGQLRYHPEGASTCLDAVARATCDELQSAPRIASGCDDVVRPNTVVGNRCWGAAQCEGGQCVGEAGGCPGTCVAYPPPGSVCDVAAGPPERTCDPTVQYCG